MERGFIVSVLALTVIALGPVKSSFCPDSLCFCPDVLTADCSNRNLQSIPAGLPSSIRTLILSRNKFHILRNDTFDPITNFNITNLVMDNCQMKNISERSFASLEKLEYLDLSFNNLNVKDINNGIKYLGKSSLRVFNMSGTLFDSRLFPVRNNNVFLTRWLRSLREVVIRSCGIRYFSFKSFAKLTNISKIDLGNNLISNYILPNTSVPSLQELNFTDNYFKKVPGFCLDYARRIPAFPNLQTLHLAVNDIRETANFIKEGFCLKYVEFLNVSHTSFQEISLYSFLSLSHLQILIIDNLHGVTLDSRSLSSKSLRTLSIGRMVQNSLIGFADIFSECRNIKSLKIMNTGLSKTDVVEMLSPLKDLSYLAIVNGEIEQMTALNSFTNLTSIDFSFNRIKEIRKSVVQNLTTLKLLVLRGNRLSNMKESSLSALLWKKKDFWIDVSFNPLDCGCQLEWFRLWVENNQNRTVGYPAQYICASPSDLKDKSIANFDPISECHKISPYVILACISFAFVSLVIVTIVLLRKFRWDIKYYIYTCKNRKPMGYKRFTDDEFLYDGFVAYNTNDRKWIMSELVQMVERNNKYKLCLHERDILPGGIFVDDILESIEVSRKFMLVLSNNFMDDQWCKYETAIANHTLVDGGGHKLLLILLQDIHSEHINKSLKVLLNSVSHVEWTMNRNGQKLFWQTVKQFMGR
ncbi:toll-like receptor 2 type-1 [Ostrea edulis]|uniref:toll-like receptor 2 type-1 n=1 Tax=Ostrea edulis TaxID=37623 RepID=UPI0024AF9C31|nr:toll-like receptor 2 type-1 [Ostrea edulis]